MFFLTAYTDAILSLPLSSIYIFFLYQYTDTISSFSPISYIFSIKCLYCPYFIMFP